MSSITLRASPPLNLPLSPSAASVHATSTPSAASHTLIPSALHNPHHTSLAAHPLGQGQESDLNATFPPPPDLTPRISRQNDQYIAGGGFGDVYRCWYNDSSPKEVAVKAFRFNFTLNGDTSNKSVKMLRRELGIWRRLDHINVVPFLGVTYGFGLDGAMSLVSLWMPNGSLHHFLEKYNGNLGIGHRLQLLLNIANGLHYLHSFPIVHGELNSNNVLLGEDYVARLGDFGHASLVGKIPESLTYLQRSTTSSRFPVTVTFSGDACYYSWKRMQEHGGANYVTQLLTWEVFVINSGKISLPTVPVLLQFIHDGLSTPNIMPFVY